MTLPFSTGGAQDPGDHIPQRSARRGGAQAPGRHRPDEAVLDRDQPQHRPLRRPVGAHVSGPLRASQPGEQTGPQHALLAVEDFGDRGVGHRPGDGRDETRHPRVGRLGLDAIGVVEQDLERVVTALLRREPLLALSIPNSMIARSTSSLAGK